MAKRRYRYIYQMSEDIHRSKAEREKFLKWLNSNPEFKTRRPTVEETVREMTRKGGCLRDLVEQDVQKAAMHYWRQEAQYYLRHVDVVRINLVTKETTPPIKAFIPLGSKDRNGHIPEENYIPSRRIANDPSASRKVLEQAYWELENWLQRYEDYTEFFDLFEEIVFIFKTSRSRITNHLKGLRVG